MENETKINEIGMTLNKIMEKENKWYVYSEDGSKKLGGPYDTEEEAKKRLKQVESFKHNTIQNITTNIVGNIRYDKMEGRKYMVVPMVMITHGVHSGSNGPLYYPEEELSKTPAVWNHKPVVVYHPQINGVGVSACDPDILSNRKVGLIMNTKYQDGKLKAEAWLEEDRVKLVDSRIIKALDKKQIMELSTGLFSDNEMIEGEWNGKQYMAIARNYRPDHLALLPDQKGACSVADGAGFLRLNQESYTEDNYMEIGKALVNLIRGQGQGGAKQGDGGTDTCICPKCGATIKHERGSPCANQKCPECGTVMIGQNKDKPDGQESGLNKKVQSNKRKEKRMDKEKFIDELIKNSSWIEEDREYLMGLEEEHLLKFVPVVNKDKEEETKKEEEVKSNPIKNKDVTIEDFIANAPEPYQEYILEGLKELQVKRDEYKKIILANENNIMTENELNLMKLDQLRALSALARKPEDKRRIPIFTGLGDVGSTSNKVAVEEPLTIPTLNFKKE